MKVLTCDTVHRKSYPRQAEGARRGITKWTFPGSLQAIIWEGKFFFLEGGESNCYNQWSSYQGKLLMSILSLAIYPLSYSSFSLRSCWGSRQRRIPDVRVSQWGALQWGVLKCDHEEMKCDEVRHFGFKHEPGHKLRCYEKWERHSRYRFKTRNSGKNLNFLICSNFL